ncbi:beta-lactamase-like protein 2 homolog isoform X2 [Anabrus simplex]|uniref:beta-lactamase-like protein 2 homolog isoform X2 n=1 Tax=Anabrus simplex TaxID=316456 RepID=UPI0034DD5FC1
MIEGVSQNLRFLLEGRVLLDTGDPNVPQYITNLHDVLKKEGVNLEHIIITHWHHDHIGGVKDVMDSVKNDYTPEVWKFKGSSECDTELEELVPFSFLKDEQEFAVEGATLKVIHTPGHTSDHIILCLKEEDVMFSGDCILGEGTAVFEDLHDYMSSLQRILQLKPKIIYPGHGPSVEDPLPKIQYYIDHRNQREKQILEVLYGDPQKSFSEMDIVKIIYKDTHESLYAAAAYNVSHHLSKLQKENKVVKNGEQWQSATKPQASL